MTEPFRPLACPTCGWTSAHAPGCPNGAPAPTSEMRYLLTSYINMRGNCADLEGRLSEASELSPQDLKRLDKAVTVMKVGFKIIKKVLRAHDVPGLGTWRGGEVASNQAGFLLTGDLNDE